MVIHVFSFQNDGCYSIAFTSAPASNDPDSKFFKAKVRATVEVSSFLATPVEGRSTGTAALPAEDLSFDHPALDKGAGRLRLTEASSA